MMKEAKNCLTDVENNAEDKNEVKTLLSSKKVALTLAKLDKSLGLSLITYNTPCNKTNALALGVSMLACAFSCANPSIISVSGAVVCCGLAGHLINYNYSKNIYVNIYNICNSASFCNHYELAYLKNLDDSSLEKAKEILTENGLLSKEANEREFTSIINTYATKASFNNLLYYAILLALDDKRVAKSKERKMSAYIQQRSIAIKEELLTKLKEM